MVKLVSFIISKIKHREYKVDENITSADLCGILAGRLAMLIRGAFKKIGFKKAGKMMFIGKRVSIKSKGHIKCGSGVTINDDCSINALCRGGVEIGNNFFRSEEAALSNARALYASLANRLKSATMLASHRVRLFP
ncbi:MAG: hypothetical protein L6V88_07930 [Anaerotruncus sp.]|nr:MAG: hypothetical protein L6V88_07930 [Anaerotruncus sp.]